MSNQSLQLHWLLVIAYCVIAYRRFTLISNSNDLPIVSDALSLQKCTRRGWTLQKSLPLPIQTLTPCLFKLSPFIKTSLMHVLIYPILPSYNWPSSPPRTLYFTSINFCLQTLHCFFLR